LHPYEEAFDEVTVDPKKACLINCELFGKQAALFEEAIVPIWQGVYDSLLARARIAEGSTVLDVGAGTGEVALRASRLVGPNGRIVAADVQPEMLRIAERKAKDKGASNIEFRVTPMETLNLRDNTFDSVVGNYSLCCCIDYEATLSECLRVLKPGGRLTYNHGGPSDPLTFQIVVKIFEKYKTSSPSKHLQEIREAELMQYKAVEKYREPSVTLEVMRGLGYEGSEATLTQRVLNYKDVGSFIDEWIRFDWATEAEEMPLESVERFRREAIGALSSLSNAPGFRAVSDMVFFTGTKP
jgi:ubiquinone/menaquinone biosynthesis C-methylase UbiE